MLQCRLSPEWVLDDMTMYEAGVLLNYSYLIARESWEQARLIGWAAVQPHSKKKLKLSDIIAFPWDENSVARVTTISNDEINRLQQRANKIATQWQKQQQK